LIQPRDRPSGTRAFADALSCLFKHLGQFDVIGTGGTPAARKGRNGA